MGQNTEEDAHDFTLESTMCASYGHEGILSLKLLYIGIIYYARLIAKRGKGGGGGWRVCWASLAGIGHNYSGGRRARDLRGIYLYLYI